MSRPASLRSSAYQLHDSFTHGSALGGTRDIVVVGASAGGIEALSSLAASLPPDLPAALFVVQHTACGSPGLLAAILDTEGPLSAETARSEAGWHGWSHSAETYEGRVTEVRFQAERLKDLLTRMKGGHGSAP